MARCIARLRALFLLTLFLGAGVSANNSQGVDALSASEVRVLEAYIAVYSRPPDPDGLRYWAGRLDAEGGSLQSIISAFGESDEFKNRFSHLEYAELIRNVYLRLFNREPEPEGAAFYLAALDSGEMDLGDIAIRILDGAQNTDEDAVANKTTAAAYFVDRVEESDAAFPSDGEALAPLLRPVNALSQSVSDAFESIDQLLESWSASSTLITFSSADALLDYLKSALMTNAIAPGPYPDFFLVDAVAEAPGGAESGESFSRTTVQEEGVDEADSVKTDGAYLYVAGQNGAYCCPGPFFEDVPEVEPAAIRILEMLDAPPGTREIARIDGSELTNAVDGLYLVTNRAEDRPDLLVTVGGGASTPIWTTWLYPWDWYRGEAEITLFDVENPAAPTFLATIELEGELIATRRIDETLYVVTRFVPSPEGYEPYSDSPLEELGNQFVVDSLSLEDLLPKYTLTPSGGTGSLVSAATSFLPPTDADRPERPTLVSVTAIDLTRPDLAPVTASIIGPTETVYVSREAVYLATTRHDYFLPFDTIATDIAPTYPHRTDVHKFALSASGPAYRASGRVVGHLGWEPGKKPFRMGEHEGVLRVATSLGDDWNGTASTRLTLLRESDDAASFSLEETAHLDNIGKEGERLYASRFIGDRAYLVTFRITDPLYVFDLSEPEKIEQLVELEIDGYSDFLYPLGQDLLLGIGKDAVPDPAASDLEGRGAWYQGVKLALFDVSGDGREISSLVLGKRGTESDALYNHHAISFLQTDEPDTLRLALPVRLHDGDDFDASQPWIHFPWKRSGLYLFEIGTASGSEGIDSTGTMIVADDSSGGPVHYSYGEDRSVLVGPNVHFVHGGQIWSATWDNPSVLFGPE